MRKPAFLQRPASCIYGKGNSRQQRTCSTAREPHHPPALPSVGFKPLPCPSRGGGTGVPAKADSENITAAPRPCAGANIPWRGAGYKGMSGRIQPCNHGPQIFLAHCGASGRRGSSVPAPDMEKNGGTRTRHGFLPSVCGIMPDKQFQTVGVIIQLHLLLELPRRDGIMLQHKVLVIQGRGRVIHPHVPRRNAAVRHGTLFCGAGTVPYTPPVQKFPRESASPPPSSPALRREEADAPAPDQTGFSQTRRKRPLHHHPAPRPLLQKAQLHMGTIPPIRGTYNHLAAIRRSAAAGKQNAASMHKHRYTAFA